MRIINSIHAQKIGGVDRVFQDYTQILSNLGHEVALVISDNGNGNYESENIYKLKNLSPVLDCLHLLYIFLKFKPDLMICHSGRLMKWMKILKIFYPFKSIGVNHGTTFKHSMKCDYAINVNKQIADDLVDAGFDKNKSFILPNAVNVDRDYEKKTIKKIPVIGIYGRFERAKGFDILIKSGKVLDEKGYDFRFKIGGFEVENSNYGLKNIQNLAEQCNILDKVNFVGTVLDKEDFFRDVDILCVPSREETFGLPILEGFLFSTLIISSDSDGGKFLIKDDENGLLFSRENHEELAEKIIKIIKNPSFSHNLTQKAYSNLVKDFNFDIIGKKIEKILLKIS